MTLKTIAIVGGGIGGLASAILLSRQGYHVTIYDKAKAPQAVGAGFLLQPPGQHVLQKIGILEDISKQAVPIIGLQSQTTSGHSVLNLKYDRLKGSPRNGLGVQRNTIYEALLREAANSESVYFHWDSDVSACTDKHDSISVIVNGTSQTYDLCILSSGSNSQLAEAHFPNRVKKPYGWGCIWTTFELPNSLSPNTLHQRCQNTNKMMGILPVRKTKDKYEAALYWSMKSEDLLKFNQNEFSALKDEISAFWPEAKSSLEPLGSNDFIPANYNDIWTPKPFKGRVIAIGDISHATSPQLGQGCTMALLDAWSLAKHLERDEMALADCLEQWWRSRRYQLAYVRHLSKILTPLFQSESKVCEIFRNWIMAPVGRLPVFNSMQLKTLASEVFLNFEE